ncbi:flagellin N-terminal helical domain-containing protein [Desulfobacula phenolica]|uniref:Flagellin n=1 Tax=Desulfobacula phenolica TaxID=90732 RepID=A0A1H2DTC2_9BACT|nr:flagellin [Desulfobacula phenolica]SDT85688.1 flagellin [Desulfobacula phenolica]
MALRINTNVASLNAHKNMIKTDNSLSSALEKLSSGLRINKAADDASGMAIADSLRSQSLGLGQAIRNGNDGISIVQTADAALEESINIVNTIKQKSIQSAQDGQTTESRKAIQADISKLTEELDTIAKTTAFNNQKLLSGNFTDKKFQIGAYAGETVDISIQSTEATKIGHINTSNLTFASEGTAELNIYSNLKNETYSLNSIELEYNNSRENSVGAVADAINKLSDVLGISATASVESSTDSHVNAGSTDTGFAINGVTIGALSVSENDSDGALVSAINNKTSEHGVSASVDQYGILTLTSTDDRAIEVTMGGEGTKNVMGGTQDMSTLGTVEVRQEGTSEIVITDANVKDGIAISTVEGSLTVKTETAVTTKDSVVAAGSKLVATTVGSGTVVAGSLKIDTGEAASGVAGDTIGAGSVITSGSTIGSGTTIQGSFAVSGSTATAANTTSVLTAGSSLTSGSTVGNGSIFKGDVSAFFEDAGGNVVVSGSGADMVTKTTADVAIDDGETLTLAADAKLAANTELAQDSVVAAGSVFTGDIGTKGDNTVTGDMTIVGDSLLKANSVLETGSSLSDQFKVTGNVTGTMTLEIDSKVGATSVLTDGSAIGADVTIKDDITVGYDTDMLLEAGSKIAAKSTLTAGTHLTNDITDENDITYKEGTTLENDIVVKAEETLTKAMVINGGSILKADSVLDTNVAAQSDGAVSSVSDGVSYRLSDVDVTTQEGAQIGIAVADAALKNLDKVRSDLGSVQNQLTSTIANISTTKVNVQAAESTIRDVDFAEESANFTKMQILSQAGTFAMSQANASAQNVLSLLQ